ncbi:MAG TPA: hypothetical protein VH134_13200 [Candidatus Dormibacteraeota bacterium]|nr:hypothetical protein [Candidatus Dormibacteraeota bacterium]
MLVVATLGVYPMPARATRAARLVALAATLVALALLASELPVVLPSGRAERSLGDLVPGVALVLRADPAGVMVALLACVVTLMALAEPRRQPVERAGLLLCLTASCVAGLAGNTVLLFGGLELGNVGAVLLAAGAGTLGRRARLGLALQHVAALGLLAASIELHNGVGTTDLSALPARAVAWGTVAMPWALAGAVRLLGGAGLPSEPGQRASSSWTAVAAAPTGLIVLLRLGEAAGDAGLPPLLAGLMVAAGLAIGLGGAVEALRRHALPAAAGRALAVAAAGPVIVLAGVLTQPPRLGIAATGIALLLALAAAPAWGAGGDEGSGRAAVWLRALALAAAGGLPLGVGTTALILGAGAALPQGALGAAAGTGVAATGLLTAAAGAAAARSVLAAAPAGLPRGRPRIDALLAVAAGAVLALLPGLALGAVIDPIAAAGTAGVVDAGAVQGAAGGWAGGYLALAALVAVVAAASAAAIEGVAAPAPERRPAAAAPPPLLEAWPALQVRVLRLYARGLDGAARGIQALASLDRWLVTQPGLVVVLAGVAACLFIFR